MVIKAHTLVFSGIHILTSKRDFERSVGMLLINILPSLTARKGYLGRATVVKAYQDYFEEKGHEEGSLLVKNWLKSSHDFALPKEDIACFGMGGVFAITVSTIPTAFWMLYYVFSNPKILGILREEVSSILETTFDSAKGTTMRSLDISALRTDCPILVSTFQETLRHGSLNASVRVVTEDTIINDQYLLKKDGVVQMPAHIVHSDPTIWGPTVAEFDPFRFCRKETRRKGNKRQHPEAFRPFGGGKNLCPGRHFATTEILSLAVMMIMRYDLQPTAGDGHWTLPKSDYSSLSAAVREPDTDIEVEVMMRKGYEGGNWEFRLEDSRLTLGVIAEDQTESGSKIITS